MNREKWNNSRIPLSVLAAKFAEEAGEVAGAIADDWVALDDDSFNFSAKACQSRRQKRLQAIKEEIDHAEFLLGLIKERVG
jgi:hypothetical protein